MKNSTGNLAINSHTQVLGLNFSFSSEVASRLLAEGLYWGRGFPTNWVLPRVSTSPGTRKDKSTPYSKHNDPYFDFCATINQNILAWATLHFAILHHCISSVLSCNQNTHCAQGPKSDYTHAYSHPLSNLLSFQLPLWSLSVFSLIIFLVFILAQLPLANRRHTIGTFT